MAVITRADVKTWGRITSDTYDDELDLLIASCQAKAETFCGRKFDLASYTEYFDTLSGQSAVWVKNFPIVSIQTIVDNQAEAPRTINHTAAVRDEAELLNMGCVQLWYSESVWTTGQVAVKIIYTGGYSTSSVPADLKKALWDLVLFEFNNRGRIGIQQAGGDGAYANYDEKDGLPTQVRDALLPFVNYARRIG